MEKFYIIAIILYILVNCVTSCRWVCIDKGNSIKKELFDRNQVELEFKKHVITIEANGKKFKDKKTRVSNTDTPPSVTLRMPEFHVEPELVNCNSKEFMKSLTSTSKRIKCSPRDTVVQINYKGPGKVVPNQIVTKLCTGVCGNNIICTHLKRKNTTIAISIVDPSGRSQCTQVEVPENTKCHCKCNKTAADCLPTQVFDKKLCKCKCINQMEHRKCLSRIANTPEKFFWNTETCSCRCRYELVCTTGSQWNNHNCKCRRQ